MTTQPPDFSRRERQIVDALIDAKSVKDIALDLDLSVNTVKDYLKAIYRKAAVHSARELVRDLAPAGRFSTPPDTALAQLLHTAQALSVPAAPNQALAQLAAAVRRCTRAQRVAFGRWLNPSGELYLALEQPAVMLRAGSFAFRVHERGWSKLDTAEAGGAEARQLSRLGLNGEIIGVQCQHGAHAQVLLAAAPDCFGPLDAATIRLLARLSQSSLELQPHPHRRELAAIA
ncbi:MAG: helix-turn-helix domain-containing protein [Terriglobales bacterium]